jgi:hypothetical protein
MSQLPHWELPYWVSYAQALAVPIFLALITGFGTLIAASQMWIAREKLRLDAFDRLYNRRVTIYEATRTFLAAVFHNNISEGDIEYYDLKTLDAQFLFDETLSNYLREVHSRVVQWRKANFKAEQAEQAHQGDERDAFRRISGEQLKWITEQGDYRFPLRFGKFLVYRPAQHPWYLRWLPALDV